MALIELPPQTSNFLASWQEVIRVPLMAKSPVEAQINQNITDTIMLLEILTIQADQKPIYTHDLGALQDQVNAIRHIYFLRPEHHDRPDAMDTPDVN